MGFSLKKVFKVGAKLLTGDVIGAATTVAGGILGGKAAKKSQQQVQNAAQQLKTTLGPSAVYGPGGANAQLFGDGQGGAINLGDYAGARNALQMFGTNAINQAGSTGVPQSVLDANALSQQYGSQRIGANLGGLNFMQPAIRNQFQNANDALTGLQQNGFQRGLQNTAFAGAAQQLAAAGQDFGGVRNQTLDLLRQQAQPFESRAFQGLQNQQFASGQLGTTGGGIQTEAFARGLGQADLQRQLTANEEARAQQQQALGIGQGLAGVGSNLGSLENQLLQSAFGNFGQTAQLGQNLSQQQLQQRIAANQTNFGNANTMLGNQINLASLPTALQGQQLQLGMQGLQGAQGIDQYGQGLLQQALGMSQAAANARIGSGTNAAQLQLQAANMPTSGDIWGNVLSGIGSRVAGQGPSLGSIFGGLFGKQQDQTGGINAYMNASG